MEPSTPKKLHPRNSVCRLCGGTYESRHMLRVLGKSGIEKNLPAKIHHACGITISEADCLPKLVCRKCESFVFKVSDFKQKSGNIQNELELEQKCSVKRCTELSPSCIQPSKRAATEIHGKTSAKQLMFGQKSVQTNKGDHEEPMEEESSTALGFSNLGDVEESAPEVVCEQEIQVDTNLIIGALKSKSPSNVAEIIRKHCPQVLSSLRLLISEEINTACKNLCRRSDGSVLYGHSYQSLKDFSFANVWNEIESNIPFLVNIMNAVCGQSFTTPDLRVKYGFIYSILMSERWHELSLLKRVNTVLIIEGGCTKKVRISLINLSKLKSVLTAFCLKFLKYSLYNFDHNFTELGPFMKCHSLHYNCRCKVTYSITVSL